MKDPWRHWEHIGVWSLALLPLSLLYCAAGGLRRWFYRRGYGRVHALSVPVVVVGNVTVGGTGKTPFTAWLCAQLIAAGMRPGVVLRGYGGRNRHVLRVAPTTDPRIAGDEAVLLARRTGVPVIASPDRVRGAQALIWEGCDVIVADDGLQHYRLGRRVEIGILDGKRRFGNGLCLPSGPLREGRSRWGSLDFQVTQGTPVAGEWGMTLAGAEACAVGGDERVPVKTLGRVHAVAGIGNPGRFFAYLEELGLEVVAHAFADHHNYVAGDLIFAGADPVVMTEKDAVKCERFARPGLWYLPVTATVDLEIARRIVARLTAKE
ncbi:MAG TPA: tetraacyldisaccharide 4'-kinase [Acidiferrobacter sp.]|nr:tetraacyldisaccharide 4'-kinase [Acidiferrobacter sp.]